jgi:nitrate reductase gamma subunit
MTLDQLLYGVFPYVAIALAIVGTIWRYFRDRFSYSSMSSQFLENRQLFWGSVPWHYGILVILVGHLVAFLIPRTVLAWNGVPWRLYVLEASAMDVVLLLALLIQVVAGLWIAIFFRWGSSWYAAFAVPYLKSVFSFNPDISLVSNLPFMAEVHIIGAFVLLLLLPFTRLVHLLSVPVAYLWRPYQVVIWNRKGLR